MSPNLTVVVAGSGALAGALERTGQFARVIAIGSTSELKTLLQSHTLSNGVGDKVFMFADTTVVDTQQSLPFLLGRLSSMGVPVVVLAATPAGRDLVAQCPGAGLLEWPLKINQVLGALSGMPGVSTPLAPVASNDDIPMPGQEAEASAPAPRFGQVPAVSPFPAAPGSPFPAAPPRPAPFPAPASPFPTAPTPASAFPTPAGPASPFAAQQAVLERQSDSRGHGPSSSSFPERAATPPFGGPVDASPFAKPDPVRPAAGTDPFARPAARPGRSLTYPARRAAAPAEERPARRGRVITVAAPKGGTGKSTMSLNLAAYLGLRLRGTGRNVCLIDANVQQADTGKYLNVYLPNVENVLKDPAAIHPDRINHYLLHRPDLNMSALLGPATPESANPLHFTGKRYKQILDALRPNFDYVIIDTPVAELYHDLFREFAIPEANFIIVTISPNAATLMNTDNWLRQVTASRNADGMGFDPENIGIVLNRAQSDIGLTEDDARRELGEWNWLGSIPETKEWQRCNNRSEIVATKNYADLNRAFALVLARATGDELLRTTSPDLVPSQGGQQGGFLSRLFKGRR